MNCIIDKLKGKTHVEIFFAFNVDHLWALEDQDKTVLQINILKNNIGILNIQNMSTKSKEME